jgi:hypothetical protein
LNCAQPIWYKNACWPFYTCKDLGENSLLKEVIDMEWKCTHEGHLGQDEKWMIFHGASYYGNMEIVEYMVSNPRIGINNNRNNIHQTVLLSAIWGNQIEVVKRLLEHPLLNVNKRGNYGMFPLEVAVSRGYVEIVKLLLAHPKILINQRTKQEFMTDLGRCLEFEADPHTYTSLDIAGMRENSDILRVLLEKGAEESNVLYHASRRGRDENVRYLVDQPQITKKQGCLYEAASGGYFWTVIELLKDDFYRDSKTERGHLEYMASLEEALDIHPRDYDEAHSDLFFNKKICAFELMNYHNKQQARYVTEINMFAGLPWLPYDILREIHTMTRYIHPRLQAKEYYKLWREATKYMPRKRIECFEPEIDDTGLPMFPRYAFID